METPEKTKYTKDEVIDEVKKMLLQDNKDTIRQAKLSDDDYRVIGVIYLALKD